MHTVYHRTDHNSLKWILNLTNSTKTLARRHPEFSEYNLSVLRRASVKQEAVNALSRLQTTAEDATPVEVDLPFLAVDTESNRTSILVINAYGDGITTLNIQGGKSFVSPPTLVELAAEQALNENCKTTSLNVEHAGSELYVDHRGLLVQKSIVDKSIRNPAPISHRALILYLAHHLHIAGRL